LVVLVGLAIDQIAQSGLSSLSVIYYSAQLFSVALWWCMKCTLALRWCKFVAAIKSSTFISSFCAQALRFRQ
ncbi:hypothetical protein, partial [Klebsiella pneumoniae]|uniref:hypothetical protein n=1 Tax=Klebsiella pneumoniae TaxID=573 RepID=UPI001C6FA032